MPWFTILAYVILTLWAVWALLPLLGLAGISEDARLCDVSQADLERLERTLLGGDAR